MAYWGQNQALRKEPVLKGPDDKLTAPSDSRKTEHVPGQKSHFWNCGGRSVGMTPGSPVRVQASLGPPGAWQSSPSSTGSSIVWPETTLSLLTYSPNGKSRESGNQRQNPIPGQSLRTLTGFSGEDLGLSGQFDYQILQRSLQECLEWEELLSPVVKMLLQAFLKFQHPKSPWEILDMRDPQSGMIQLFQVMLQDFPSWQSLSDGNLKSILQQYLSSWGQQPGWGEQQGQGLRPCLPPFWYQQQPHGQWAGWREQQGLGLWLCLPPFCYQRQPHGQWAGWREQQGQMPQPCGPTVQYQQQLSSAGQQSWEAATPSPPSQGAAQGERRLPILQ